MSHTLTALAAAGPLAAGWSLHSLLLRRRIEVARRDPLTGLLARDGFEERARRSLAGGQRAVYVVDLNWFKAVNDTYGHAAGDAVLRTTGQRLGRWADDNDGVAGRLGGDEFAAIACIYGTADLRHALNDLLHRLEQPVEFDSHHIAVHASIGAARHWRTSTRDLSALLRRADEEMYKAKQGGGGWGIAGGDWAIAQNLTPELRTVNGRREGRPGTTAQAGGAA